MKKIIWFLFCLTVVAVFSASSANAIALGTNITIPDGMNGNTFSIPQGYVNTGGEDNEVEPGCITGQVWDMEGFFLKNTTLAVVGGFNMKDGYDGVKSGDIFIATNGIPKYGPANTGSSGGTSEKVVPNTFGYNYVIDVNWGGGTYSVYMIDSQDTLVDVFYTQNDESNPWTYKTGGTVVTGWENRPYSYDNLPSAEVANLLGANHYVAMFDLSFFNGVLLSDNTFYAHFTMECGNDNLMGKGTIPTAPVPEPATLILLGSCLLGLAGFRKKTK